MLMYEKYMERGKVGGGVKRSRSQAESLEPTVKNKAHSVSKHGTEDNHETQ